jgi:hypothetical protein
MTVFLLGMLVPGREAAAQSDSSGDRCGALAAARPDSMVKVDTEPTPERLAPMKEGPRDADERAVLAHFVVTAEGLVDTSTVSVEHTRDAAWIDRLRRTLATATYKPAWTGGCRIARWSTFAVWSVQP